MPKATEIEEGYRITVKTKEDAEKVLYNIGVLRNRIEAVENRENAVMQESRHRMVEGTKHDRKIVAYLEKELHGWAAANQELFPKGTRTLVLNFGKVWFRLSPPTIKLIRSTKRVLELLRAKRMTQCIRSKPEVNKEALSAYPDETLKEVGCKRSRKDEFYYEVDKTRVLAAWSD